MEAPLSGWAQLAVYHHDTREEYGPTGEVRKLFADGHAVTTSAYLTAAVGLVSGVDAWVQLPFHRLSFDDAAGKRERLGVGDPRFYLRAGPEALGFEGAPAVALRAGLKLPGADFPVDPEVIPLTEGQRDWELLLEAGHSFHPAPVYVAGWVGYRWREENEEVLRDPGDERLLYVAAGGETIGRLTWKLAVEGLSGRTPRIEGVAVETARRRMIQLLPTLGWRIDPGVVELGARVPVDGRNLPAGPALVAGYFLAWDSP